MTEEKVDFVLVTNSENWVWVPTISSVMNIFGKGHKFIWDIRGGGGYARTRNILAYHFLKDKKSDVMIFLDHDIVFNPEYIDYLLEDYKKGYDLVGGLYPVRDGTHLTSFGLENGNIIIDGGLQECKWLSTGFGLISRKLLEMILEKHQWQPMNAGSGLESYPFFEDHYYVDDGGCMWASEDYDFCIKAREVGVKCMADTRIWLGHIGQKIYEVPDVLNHQKKIMAEIEAKQKEEIKADEKDLDEGMKSE